MIPAKCVMTRLIHMSQVSVEIRVLYYIYNNKHRYYNQLQGEKRFKTLQTIQLTNARAPRNSFHKFFYFICIRTLTNVSKTFLSNFNCCGVVPFTTPSSLRVTGGGGALGFKLFFSGDESFFD